MNSISYFNSFVLNVHTEKKTMTSGNKCEKRNSCIYSNCVGAKSFDVQYVWYWGNVKGQWKQTRLLAREPHWFHLKGAKILILTTSMWQKASYEEISWEHGCYFTRQNDTQRAAVFICSVAPVKKFAESPHLVSISFLRFWHFSTMIGLVFQTLTSIWS